MQLTCGFIVGRGFWGVKCDVNCDVDSFWGVKCDVNCDVDSFWGVKCDVKCDVLQGSGRRSRPAVQPCGRLWSVARRRGERKTVLFPRGGRCPLWRLAGKSREGANTSVTNARKTAARTADEDPFGVVAERHPQPEAHKAGAIVRRAAREHGKRAGL
ncbi:hypothetical protein ACIXEF_00700 [Bacteroides fragilis]